MKKVYEIRLVVFKGMPMLQAEVNGRIYRAELNPFMNKKEQTERFVDYIAETEDKFLMKECDDFTDYMFRKISGDY